MYNKIGLLTMQKYVHLQSLKVIWMKRSFSENRIIPKRKKTIIIRLLLLKVFSEIEYLTERV